MLRQKTKQSDLPDLRKEKGEKRELEIAPNITEKLEKAKLPSSNRNNLGIANISNEQSINDNNSKHEIKSNNSSKVKTRK